MRRIASDEKILDVGCGRNKHPNAIGLDVNSRTDADVIHDLNVLPYPFPDDEFDLIIGNHVLEHVPDMVAFVTELHRIARPGGLIKLVTPHYSNPDWPLDPTHRNHINSYTLNCFAENPKQRHFAFYSDVTLRPRRVYVTLANLWRALGLEYLVNLDQRWPAFRFTRKFWEHYLSFICRGKDVYFELEVVKD